MKINLRILKKNFFIWPVLTILYFSVFSHLIPLNNTVLSSTDDPGYQIMAYNYAKGYGVMVFNIYEKAQNYCFDTPNSTGFVTTKLDAPKKYLFYRTPGYPIFFLGMVYKLLGTTDPYIGKLAALFMLCIVAAGMPWLGSKLWGTNGLFIGLISSPVQICYTAHWCDRIVTEPLIIVAVFMIACAFVLYQEKQNVGTSILLGMTLSYGFLVKGSLIFIPMLAIGYLAFWSIKKKKKIYPLLISTILLAACMITWSNYATEKSHKRVWISTQYEGVLLDANNEYSKGWWAPEWIDHPESFYNNDKKSDKPSSLRVLNFYAHYPMKLPELTIKKLMTGFIPQLFLVLLILLWVLRSIDFELKNYRIRKILAVAGITVLSTVGSIHLWVMNQPDLLISLHSKLTSNLPLLILIVIFFIGSCVLVLRSYRMLLANVPVFFYLTLINFIALSVILFGDARYVMVMHFLFILIFFEQAFSYFVQLKQNKQLEI